MQALTSARAALRRAIHAPQTSSSSGIVQRRGLATEAEVPWSDYRAGKVTLQEWVDGNRHKVGAAFVAFYVALGAWNLRPKKKTADKSEAGASAEAAPSSKTA